MKCLVLLAFLLIVSANALEREQDFGLPQSESSPAEETTVKEPVATLKPNVKDDDDDDDDDDSEDGKPTECSNRLCAGMCRRSGCHDSICLPNKRCGCVCARQISPQEFFRSIFGNSYPPRSGFHVPTFPRPFDFPTMPRFEDRFRDLSKIFESFGNSDGFDSKVYYTMQHTCEQPEDCSHVCNNCTTSNCVNNYCQCLSCNTADAIESRSAGIPEKTCSVARECDETCKGCAKTGCRFGVCQCSKCSETNRPASPTSTTEEPTTTEATETSTTESESSTVSVDIFSLTPSNGTRDDVVVNGKCVPKRCNQACWERQCSKWNCVEDRCDCESCPSDMAVVVKNADGKAAQPEDSNKYEIIF